MAVLTVAQLQDILAGLPGDMRVMLGVEHADMAMPAFSYLKHPVDRRPLGSYDILLKGDNFNA